MNSNNIRLASNKWSGWFNPHFDIGLHICPPSGKAISPRQRSGGRTGSRGSRPPAAAGRKKGQSLIEVMVGLLVIIPIGLAAVDIVVLTNASQNNEEIAETAARAASTKANAASATNAVQQIVQRVTLNNVVQDLQIDDVNFDLGKGTVSVSLIMTVKMPVPFPNFSTVSCKAGAIQPIVSTPAPR
jgi:hypothetical protein